MTAVRNSGVFDTAHYRAQNPGLLGAVFPVAHYVTRGEARKLSPYEGFWPAIYLEMNPDVAVTGQRPFLHYLRNGRREARPIGRDIFPSELPAGASLFRIPLPRIDPQLVQPSHRFAVCIHVYYPEIWPEIHAAIDPLRSIADIHVSVAYRDESSPRLVEDIRAELPQARVYLFPNHGRDIFPFTHLVNAGCFRGYEAVCKLHTKRSPHLADGDPWRAHLIGGILPREGLHEMLEKFLSDERAGVLVADGQAYRAARWMGRNRARFDVLHSRLGIANPKDDFRFPAGSVYWVKPRVLELVEQIQVSFNDFELESGQLDGTTAHAFERVLGSVALAAGLKIAEASSIGTRKSRKVVVGPQRGSKRALGVREVQVG